MGKTFEKEGFLDLLKTRAIVCLAFLFVVAGGALADPAPGTDEGEKAETAARIDAIVEPFVEAGHFSGVVLASLDGEIIYEKAFGLANADFGIPNTPASRIGIASLTKTMTLVILVRLLEEEAIALDDEVSEYLPDFPNGDQIDIEMLARHRSGIPHRVMPPEMEAVSRSSAEMVGKIAAAELEFEPGSQRLYSSAGYTLLTRILEIASGRSYAELLEEQVFEPAGMKNSVDFDGEMIIERMAKDYFITPDGLQNAPLKDYSFLIGAGSVISTARDVYRFTNALVSRTYRERVVAELVGENGLTISGRTNGHRAYVEMSRDGEKGYVVLSNLSSGAFDEISGAVSSILSGEEIDPPEVPRPRFAREDPNEDPTEFHGNYRREGATSGGFEVVYDAGRYFAGDIELFPTTKDCFFEYRFYGDVCFVRNDDGEPVHITWDSPGVSSKWVKIESE